MKAKIAGTKKVIQRGFLIPMKHGKAARPKRHKPPSPEALRNMEAEELIVALVDAAHTIGVRGVVDNYSKYDFHLYPRHIAALFPKAHPKRSVYSVMNKNIRGRVIVPWPWREKLEGKTTNELREKPFEMIGLLMRKILDADSAFFEAIAEAVRAAKIEAKQAASNTDSFLHHKGKTRAGMIVADMPSRGMGGDPDWFTRIPKPQRRGKAPHAIWSFCKARYEQRQSPPTRREIRDHLNAKSIACRNLRTQLSRMNLEQIQEGERPRKT